MIITIIAAPYKQEYTKVLNETGVADGLAVGMVEVTGLVDGMANGMTDGLLDIMDIMKKDPWFWNQSTL